MPEESIPDRLGPYRVRDRLGEGGMGVVYLATDPALRLVAVKALRHGVTGQATHRRRLAREFEMMRRVHSPFVAEVLDANVEHDPPYLVTRYVPGRTVEDVVAKDGPLTGRGLLRLARGLACALGAVHAAGIVHRDLKPGNVMLVSGEPVVIDFGIAQALDSSRLTSTGMVMGTPGYLAPEVIEGSPSGPAADVHSWAATMAFAATGRPPFGTGAYEAIFYRIVNGQPDLATMPAPLLPLVLHALARDPGRRPSAAELADRVAALDPATLVPDLAPTLPPGSPRPGGRPVTLGDARPTLAGGPAALAGGAALAGARGGPAGRGAPVRSAPDNYADLLPPVQYGQRGAVAPVPGQAGFGQAGFGQPGTGQPGPVQPGMGQPGMGQRGPGQLAPGAPGQPYPSAADRPRSARRPLVLAVLAALVSAAILLPIAGTIVALAVLTALRSVDLTLTWVGARSRAGRAAGAVTAAALAPGALLRSVLSLLFRLPVALFCAAAAAAATLLLVPSDPIRAAGYAAGAGVACYALGPGSERSRRPLSSMFGAVTASTPSAVVTFIGATALALGMLAAAISLPPFIWPAIHFSPHLSSLPLVRGATQLPHQFSTWQHQVHRWTSWLGG